MTNITNMRIITICKLKAIGINDDKINAKVLTGSVNTIKAIYSKHIRCKDISLKQEFYELFNFKTFRISHYHCIRCHCKHYFNTKIYDTHYHRAIKLFGNVERRELVSETLNYILKRHYNNNKDNKEFQGLIEYIDYILSVDSLKYMNNTLRSFVIKTYKTKLLKQFNVIMNKMNLKIQNNIQILKEIIGHIDYFNYLNNKIIPISLMNTNKVYNGRKLNTMDLDKPYLIGSYTQRLRLRRTHDVQGYSIDLYNNIMKLINSNKDTKDIMNKLNLNNGIIDNKVLYNKILLLIEQYKETLYEMNYGIRSYKKETQDGIEIVGALPFSDSGRFTSTFDNYEELNSLILYCYDKVETYKGIDNKTYKTGYKSRINYIFSNDNIQLLDKGINKTKNTAKRYISYRLITNNTLQDKIDVLKYNTYLHIESQEKQQLTTKHITRLIKSRIYKKPTKHIDYKVIFDITENKIKHYDKDISFNFDYNNKGNKAYRYNKYVNNLKLRHYFKTYMIFYPLYDNDKYLYCSFGHLMNPPVDPLADKVDRNKMGNLRNEYIFRDKMPRHMYSLIWILSGKVNLKQLMHLKNKTEIKTKLIEFLNYCIDKNMLNNNLRQYLLGIMKQIKNQMNLRTQYYDKLIHKELILTEIYDNYDNKRTKQAKHTKNQIKSLITKIEKQNSMFNVLYDQRFNVFKFYTLIFNRTHIIDVSKLIYNLFITQIKQYYIKNIVRYVNTRRSTIELIKLGLNNMNYDLSYEMNTRLNKDKITVVYKDKFEELLDYSNEEVSIVKLSDQKCVPIKSLFKALLNVLKHDNNEYFVNYILFKMYKVTRDYQNLESNILNS